MYSSDHFDVIVVGGGHAGIEAALASARMGAKTLLLTHNVETIGQMSCNPAIGGIGKSQLVREVDALGGLMARAVDLAGIQFRVLNGSKGPAVRATRAQADRSLYRSAVRETVENQDKLLIFQQAVTDFRVQGERIQGVTTETGLFFSAPAVVLTAGTFLAGKIHVGLQNYPGGRAGDPPASALASRLRELALGVDRLKTGTPPRIDQRSVDFSELQEQWGDDPRPVMSFSGCREDHPQQVCCWITHTNEDTHGIIREGLDRSPMYTGVIEGVGPRYCPSIEDKVERFSDKSSHQIFVEPEGLNTNELYPNGISTSLPYDVQLSLVRSIKGFQNAHITRPGYAIEYDYFDPRGLRYSLESKAIKGLFMAGQINGTTGYEEAAAQGLLAGLNATLHSRGQAPWTPRRDQAYLGVLVDDLIRMGAPEPYRMFTSRAEYRLLLREDNADLRLTEVGRGLGLIGEEQWKAFNNKREQIESEEARLSSVWVKPRTPQADTLDVWLEKPLTREYNLFDLLKRPELSYKKLTSIKGFEAPSDICNQASEQVEIGAKYAGYIDRQREEIERLKRHEDQAIPEDFEYDELHGLSNEVKQILNRARPENLARAARLPGITPAAVSLLLIHLKRQPRSGRKSA